MNKICEQIKLQEMTAEAITIIDNDNHRSVKR